jgi:hypothetical protein
MTTKIETRDAPATQIVPRPIRAGDKVVRDSASQDQGRVRIGEGAPVFGR